MTNQITTMKFADTIAEVEKTINDAKERAKVVLFDAMKQVFVDHPEVQVITWTQYTPYFNDGDACEFGVGDVYVSSSPDCNHWGEINEDDDDDVVGTGASFVYSHYQLNGLTGWDDVSAILDFMQSPVGAEILEFSLGDHAVVKVTPNGISVEEYNHD
jgi:hypothetical protein